MTKPKPMMPVKAWACVEIKTGKLTTLNRNFTWQATEAYRTVNERIARVEIREITHAPKSK